MIDNPLSPTPQPEAPSIQPAPARKTNWRQVITFLCLTFSLTWLLDLAMYLNGGLKSSNVGLGLQLQMLLPAFSALLLGVFFFKGSPVYHKTNHSASRWFVYFYFLLTLLYITGFIASYFLPGQATLFSQLLLIVGVLGLILLIVLRLVGGKTTFSAAGMGGGKPIAWLLFGLALIAFYGVQTLLNYMFKLGTPVDFTRLYPPEAIVGIPVGVLFLSIILNAVILGPFLGLIIAFGEEYGWRGYLQSELNHLGRVRGTFLLGVIWGIWHWPVIWMGYNYPGEPLWGSLMMVGMCILLAFFLAYAVFKSQGIWTAVYLHALNNQTASFFMMAVIAPTSMLMSFGIGVPALVLGTLLVLLLLRDPVWKVVD